MSHVRVSCTPFNAMKKYFYFVKNKYYFFIFLCIKSLLIKKNLILLCMTIHYMTFVRYFSFGFRLWKCYPNNHCCRKETSVQSISKIKLSSFFFSCFLFIKIKLNRKRKSTFYNNLDQNKC